jgi:hypothetical protein
MIVAKANMSRETNSGSSQRFGSEWLLCVQVDLMLLYAYVYSVWYYKF